METTCNMWCYVSGFFHKSAFLSTNKNIQVKLQILITAENKILSKSSLISSASVGDTRKENHMMLAALLFPKASLLWIKIQNKMTIVTVSIDCLRALPQFLLLLVNMSPVFELEEFTEAVFCRQWFWGFSDVERFEVVLLFHFQSIIIGPCKNPL